MIGKTITELKVGNKAQFAKTIAESDIYLYAGITFFNTRIVHGMLLGGLLSTVIGTILPGPGTIYISQELNFLAPAQIGNTITAHVEVVQVILEKNRIHLKTFCVKQDGIKVLDGEAIVSPPKPM